MAQLTLVANDCGFGYRHRKAVDDRRITWPRIEPGLFCRMALSGRWNDVW